MSNVWNSVEGSKYQKQKMIQEIGDEGIHGIPVLVSLVYSGITGTDSVPGIQVLSARVFTHWSLSDRCRLSRGLAVFPGEEPVPSNPSTLSQGDGSHAAVQSAVRAGEAEGC